MLFRSGTGRTLLEFTNPEEAGQKILRTGDEIYLYFPEAEGMETVNGRECYVLKLTAKNRNAVYPGEKLWVDSELFVLRKAYYYALSGRLIKEMEIRKVIKVKGKNIPVWFVMEDRMKKNSRTTFIINNIQIDVPVDPEIFSLEELSW